MKNSYGRFLAMVLTGTMVMFGVMYLNTWEIDHLYLSVTRVYMAMLMAGTMAAVMLLFMRPMYTNRKINAGIFAGAAALFVAGLVLVRTQTPIGDMAYMKGMIPHHSIAILTSERATLRDPRVIDLAREISATQKKEIAEMKALVEELEGE